MIFEYLVFTCLYDSINVV